MGGGGEEGGCNDPPLTTPYHPLEVHDDPRRGRPTYNRHETDMDEALPLGRRGRGSLNSSYSVSGCKKVATRPADAE